MGIMGIKYERVGGSYSAGREASSEANRTCHERQEKCIQVCSVIPRAAMRDELGVSALYMSELYFLYVSHVSLFH